MIILLWEENDLKKYNAWMAENYQYINDEDNEDENEQYFYYLI
jgi:hypothetical protein